MMITFSAFRTAINTLVFPDGQAEVRVPLFRNFIVNALIQLQTYVESYQLVNVNFYDKDQSWDDCGLSIIQACRGRIGAVYAFKPSCRCQRHFYDSASLEKISCLYEHCRCHQTGQCCCGQSMFSSPSLYTANPYYCGDKVIGTTGCQPPYLAANPEDDCGFKLSDKFFAIGPNQKLWLFPRFPCGYVVGVHWKGIRRSYLDNDYVPDDDDLKDAVAIYVESELARRVDKDQATADKLYAEYRLKAGDIIFREEQDLKPRATRACVEGLDLSELVQIYPDNNYPTEIGEECHPGGVTVPVMDLNIESQSNNIIVEWTQAETPASDEIFRGGTEIASVPGTVSSYSDTQAMASMEERCFTVQASSGNTHSGFSNEYCAVKDMVYFGTAPSEPLWRMAFGNFAPDDPTIVTSVSFPALKRIRGILYLDSSFVLVSANFNSLQIVDTEIHFDSSGIPSLSLPALATIGGGTLRLVQYNGTTPEMLAPALLCDQSHSLTSVWIPSLIFENGKIYTFDACALTAASIEHILTRILASNCTHAFVTLDANPVGLLGLSAQGQADYATAIARGNSVSIEP